MYVSRNIFFSLSSRIVRVVMKWCVFTSCIIIHSSTFTLRACIYESDGAKKAGELGACPTSGHLQHTRAFIKSSKIAIKFRNILHIFVTCHTDHEVQMLHSFIILSKIYYSRVRPTQVCMCNTYFLSSCPPLPRCPRASGEKIENEWPSSSL
jgi:hypothetical protein